MKNKKIDEFFHEEQFFKGKKREERFERKLKQKLDRSKWKKTDQKKKDFQSSNDNLKKGRVLSIHREEIIVDVDNTFLKCQLKGALHKEKTKNRNLICVGDLVFCDPEEKIIHDIEKRKSILSRTDLKSQKQHIIASNIDQVFITTSVMQPTLKPFLLDRYIIAAEKGNMTPIIVINKIDLLDDEDQFRKEEIEKEKQRLKECLEALKQTQCETVLVSTKTLKGIDTLKKLMQNKASVFSGQSGVGKSSLINLILNTQHKTGVVAKKTQKGSHITTHASLIPLDEGGFCIDTPGIKSFGLWNLSKHEVQNHFPDIKKFAHLCKFNNCLHIDEPGCKVIEAVEKEEILPLRFESYRCLIEEIIQKEKDML
ncbi:MAG TPA: ribosome small subunit-dependent GTPase A [Chlamydiales bacterium]|nr:ribosome small subunit-dependent GTPase A [Chlamydiales bacterium]